MFNPAYISKRNDILKFVPKEAKQILDIGCSNGALGKEIKK